MVTRGFSTQKSSGPDTSLSPQSQLRQAGVYLQPQPIQSRAPQPLQQQQQPHQQHQSQNSITVSYNQRTWKIVYLLIPDLNLTTYFIPFIILS